jgi:hypothetical protein
MVGIGKFQVLFLALFSGSRWLIYSDVSYQWDDDLTVAAGGEGVLRGELLPDLLMVVNLSVGLFIKSTGTQLENVWQ